MSASWKDRLKELKRQLEDEKMKEVLTTRARERDTKKSIGSKPLGSKPLLEKRSHAGASSHISSPIPLLSKHGPLPIAPPWGAVVPKFNIGIDFGTSATKICVRQYRGVAPDGSEPIYLLHLGGSNSYLSPSVVLIKNDALYFGDQAEDGKADAFPLRHLKACLACEIESPGSTSFAECSAVREPDTGKCAGSFKCLQPLLASQLVTLYLAWAMNEARAIVSSSLGLTSDTAFTYHVGLPLAHLDESSCFASQYMKVLYQAWRISGGVTQGLEVDKAIKWLKEVNNEPVPDEENSPIQMAPEIVASLVPFLNGSVRSVSLAPGLYGLIDIGAWTTDVAMFRYSSTGAVSFPVTSVRRTGCNTIDERMRLGLLELVGADSNSSVHLFEAIRAAREKQTFDQSQFHVARYKVTPPPCLQDYSLRIASARIWSQFLKTVQQAHRNWQERYKEEVFARFHVFMLGGGSNITLLSKAPDYFGSTVTKLTSALPSLPEGFKVLTKTGHSPRQLSTDDYRRLAIAHGLAFPAGTWPEVTRPSEVRPVTPPPPKEPPTHEDLGYDEK